MLGRGVKKARHQSGLGATVGEAEPTREAFLAGEGYAIVSHALVHCGRLSSRSSRRHGLRPASVFVVDKRVRVVSDC